MVDLPRWSPAKLPLASRHDALARFWRPVASNTIVHFCMPQQARPFPGMANVNYTMFEGSRIPDRWVEASRGQDMVVLTTETCRDMWLAAGVPEKKLRVCPLGVDCDAYRPGVEPIPLEDEEGRPVSSYAARFLNVTDIVPRKNMEGLFRCWLKATERSDDVILIWKLGCGSPEWLARFMAGLEAIERNVGRDRRDAGRILWMVNRRLPDADMPRLFAAATHYWSMSRGEGWDLGMTQAAATGLELIAPHHTAYRTYLDGSVAHPLPAHEEPADFEWSHNLHALFEGATWWEPDEAAAVDAVRRAVRGELESKGAAAAARMANEYTWSHAAARLLEHVREVDEGRSGAAHPTGRLLLSALRPI
jgi:glycosyltransferase involved in cell wall biosynthesis